MKGVAMAENDPEFQASIILWKNKKLCDDFNALQNEIAGNETGRIPRFFSRNNNHNATIERKRKEFAQLSALALRLQDETYAQLYCSLHNTIQRLSTATAEMMGNIQTVIDGKLDRLK